MKAAQKGDRVLYDRLLREIAPYARQIARRYHGSRESVEDVVQEILLAIHRSRHAYDPSRSFVGWMYTIAHCRSVDILRQRMHRESMEKLTLIDDVICADPRAAAYLQHGEDKEFLSEAIALLPPKQRRAVQLLKLGELSLAEAAVATGQSVGALKVSLHRALRTLRKRLVPKSLPAGCRPNEMGGSLG